MTTQYTYKSYNISLLTRLLDNRDPMITNKLCVYLEKQFGDDGRIASLIFQIQQASFHGKKAGGTRILKDFYYKRKHILIEILKPLLINAGIEFGYCKDSNGSRIAPYVFIMGRGSKALSWHVPRPPILLTKYSGHNKPKLGNKIKICNFIDSLLGEEDLGEIMKYIGVMV